MHQTPGTTTPPASTTGPQAASRPWRLRMAYAVAAACALVAGAAQAQDYPGKPVRVVGNLVAGGPNDIFARVLAEGLQTELKQPFYVEAKPGAGGNVGADAVAKAAPDGYTLLVSIDTTFTMNPSLYAAMPFKPEDLKPVMVVASLGMLLGVNPSVGAKSLPDFIARAKAQPMNFSSAGNGTPGHIEMALFTEATGVQATHIPYKGNLPAVQAVVAGEVQAGIIATSGMAPQVQAGRVQALAVTSRQRSPLLPDVPTVAELGLKPLEVEILQLVMVPAATPEPIVQRLQTAIRTVLDKPETQARMKSLDLRFIGSTGKAAADRLAANRALFARVIQTTGMKID